MRALLRNKKGDDPSSGTFFVIIGFIIGALILLLFFSILVNFLKPKDTSLIQFNQMSDKISEIMKSPGSGTIEPVLSHINPNEIILFFDKGRDPIVKISGIYDKEDLKPHSNFFSEDKKTLARHQRRCPRCLCSNQ